MLERYQYQKIIGYGELDFLLKVLGDLKVKLLKSEVWNKF